MQLKSDRTALPETTSLPAKNNVFDLFWKDAERLHATSGVATPLSRRRALTLALRPELFALVLYRWAHFFNQRNWHGCANILYRLNLTMTGAAITPDSTIGGGCLLVHTAGVVIDAEIGEDCTIFAHVIAERSFSNNRWSERPRLGNNVAVFSQSCILGNITVADGVVIGPYSLILESIVLAGCTVSHIPGKIKIVSRINKIK